MIETVTFAGRLAVGYEKREVKEFSGRDCVIGVDASLNVS